MPAKASIMLTRLDKLTSAQIKTISSTYPAAIAAKSASTSSSSSSKPGETLVELDAWYQSHRFLLQRGKEEEEGGERSGIRHKADLVKLMRWKLSREKHRPTLMALIHSNPADVCRDVLERAAGLIVEAKRAGYSINETSTEELLGAVEKTMKILMELKGVGPATSSAIVAAWVEWGIFQSDELVQNLRGGAGIKIDYTMGFYKKFYREAMEVLKGLQGREEVQSGREMERVAWSLFYAPESIEVVGTETTGRSIENKGEIKEELGPKAGKTASKNATKSTKNEKEQAGEVTEGKQVKSALKRKARSAKTLVEVKPVITGTRSSKRLRQES